MRDDLAFFHSKFTRTGDPRDDDPCRLAVRPGWSFDDFIASRVHGLKKTPSPDSMR